jgi:amidase
MTQPPPRTRVHAFGDDALGDHDAVGLAGEIRAGRVSPLEAVDAAIARVERLQPELNGMVCADFDRARALARTASTGDGFFAGVPTFFKDNVDVEGLPTQNGCGAYTARPATADGEFATMFRRLGIVSLGKTRLSEFGFSPTGEYADADPVRNPWHTGHSSGGSSAGSAVFVASGAVPFAHAVDGGGSIRIPAGCNGLVGLKPTRDRVAQDKTFREMPVRIVADGVVSRSVRDTAAFLRESEKYHRNLELPPVGDVRGPGRKRLKVAMVVNSVHGLHTDPEVAEALRATGKLLESLGHHVEEIEAPVPESFVEDFLSYWCVFATYFSVTGRRTLDPSFDRSRLENLTRGLARNGARKAYRLPLALARLRWSHLISARFFRGYDVGLTPVLARPTAELGWLDPNLPYELLIERLIHYVSFTPLQNATGDPAISLPLGTSAGDMPIGVQLTAPQGHETRLLEVAYELEAARPFPRIQDA